MLTPGRIAREAAPWPVMLVLFAQHDRWGWFAWVGAWFLFHCGLTVALWISEAGLRESAAQGFVKGEPLLMSSRVLPDRPPREVSYIEPAHYGHWVQLGTVKIVAESEHLTRPVTDFRV